MYAYRMSAEPWNIKKLPGGKLSLATLSLLLSMVLTGSAQRTYMRTCDCEYVVDGKCAYTLLLPLDKSALPADGDSCPSPSGFPSSPRPQEFTSLVQNVTQLQRQTTEQALLLSRLQSSMITLQQTVTTTLVQIANTSSRSTSSSGTGQQDLQALQTRLDTLQGQLTSVQVLADSTTKVLIDVKNDTDTLRNQVNQLNGDTIPDLERKILTLQKTLTTLSQGGEGCAKRGLLGSTQNGTLRRGVTVQLSSEYNNQHGLDKVSVHAVGAWCPREPNEEEWIQFDLGSPRVIYGVVTRGRADYTQWVTTYQLQYGDVAADGEEVEWNTYTDILGQDQVFPGNSDQNSLQTNMLWQTITAQMIRLVPLAAYQDSNKCMRADLIGCIDNS